ncbi:hypothetical protein BTS2_0315 [Bacillus sp. TS-2]|nr:hypothetical protein BTS2_0315 [Bacillus sp. TS-2]
MPVQISSYQFMVLITLYVLGSSILVLPSALVGLAKQDAWLSALMAIGFGLIFVFIYTMVYRKGNQQSFGLLLESAFGKVIGGFFILVFGLFSLYIASLTLRDVGDFLKSQIIPETPIYAIQFLILVPALIAMIYGIEVLARTAEILFPMVIIIVFITILLSVKDFNFDFLTPILEEGIPRVFKGSLLMTSIPFLELSLLLTIYPMVNQSEKAKKAMYVGVIFGGIILVFKVLITILTIGPQLTSIINFPNFFVVKKIYIGDFLQRIEVFIAIQWIMTSFIKLCLMIYIGLKLLEHLFKLSSYRMLIFPIVFIIFAIAQAVSPNASSIIYQVGLPWVSFVFIVGGFVPLLLVIMIRLKKKTLKSS